jgi:hypothetical protein
MLVLAFSPAYAEDGKTALFQGPLWSHSTFIPAALYYQLPGMKAAIRDTGALDLGLYLYTGQTFIIYEDTSLPPPSLAPIIDFETLTLEQRTSWTVTAGLELGLTARLILIYGGFLDTIIHNFHLLFGFPLNGRDVLPENQVYISIPNTNNVYLELDHPAFAPGDIDLWAKIGLLKTPDVVLTGLCVLKLPTGNPLLLTGSGYVDLAGGLLFDWYLSELFALYVNAAIVVPWDAIDPTAPSKPFVMANVITGLEFRASPTLSLVAQVELRTTPVVSGVYKIPGTDIDFLGVPQTNILLGVSLDCGDWTFRFHFREDLFTHNSEDITFYLAAEWRPLNPPADDAQ